MSRRSTRVRDKALASAHTAARTRAQAGVGNAKPTDATIRSSKIVVTLGNADADHDKHEAFKSYRYNDSSTVYKGIRLVPVSPGLCFCIHVGYDGLNPPWPEYNAGLHAEVFMDGVGPVEWGFITREEINNRIREKSAGEPVTEGDLEMEFHRLDNGLVRPFHFHTRETTENEAEVSRDIDMFGHIVVRVWWATDDPSIKVPSGSIVDPKIDPSIFAQPINEKKKMIEHSCAAGLAEAEADHVGDERDTTVTRPLQRTAYQFCFLYRDAEWLRAKGILPRRFE